MERSGALTRGMSSAGIVDADPLVLEKAKLFMLVAVAFLGALYTNVKTLQYANVETFIVFRSSTPILIAIMDYCFLVGSTTRHPSNTSHLIPSHPIRTRTRTRAHTRTRMFCQPPPPATRRPRVSSSQRSLT